jgi:hypothetical protein
MSNAKENILTKLYDVGFSIFYFALFPLQMLPGIAIMLLELSNPWLWITCVVGIAAMVIQSIKFPSFQNSIWRNAAIASMIVAFVVR